MKYALAAVLPLVLLAGCGGNDVDLKNASVADVAKATRDAARLDPGQWRSTVEIVAVDMPGMPEKEKQMASAMFKRMIGQKQINEHCITKEQAEKPPAEMMSGGNSACRFDQFQMSDGKMNAKMNCSAKDRPGTMQMTMTGDFGGKTYALASEMAMSGGPGMPAGAQMVIKAKNSGERIGECKAAPAGKGG